MKVLQRGRASALIQRLARPFPNLALWLGGSRPPRHLVGLVGEALVVRQLRARGCRLLQQRLGTAQAEIDLVALDPRGVLLLIEVKSAWIPMRALDGVPPAWAERPCRSWSPGQAARLVAVASRARRRSKAQVEVWLAEVLLHGAWESAGLAWNRVRLSP